MKRLVFCFDGSWNKLSAEHPTNVVLMAESIRPTARDGTKQIVYYDEGVGTASDEVFRGGAFGKGLLTNMKEAYQFLIFNHEPGDEIFVFGFSRGAYTARSFVGFIRHAGILDIHSAGQIDSAVQLYVSAMTKDGDDKPKALKFRAKFSSKVCVSDQDEDWRCENWKGYKKGTATHLNIKYVGVWDTVGALGVPRVVPFSRWFNRKRQYHDVKLTSKVQNARHALAIDERRELFEPTVWNNIADLNSKAGKSTYSMDAPYQQRWFPGVHGSVGGGGPIKGLSDSALAWILAGAKRARLEVSVEDSSRVYEIAPDPFMALENDPKRPWHDRGVIGALKQRLLYADRIGPSHINDVSASARKRWQADAKDLPEARLYRPKTLSEVGDQMDAMQNLPDETGKYIKGMVGHTVSAGETLSKIAKRYLGDAELYEDVFEANRDVIDDPDELQPGMVIKIPTVPSRT